MIEPQTQAPSQPVTVLWSTPPEPSIVRSGWIASAEGDRLAVVISTNRPARENLPDGHQVTIEFNTASGLASFSAHTCCYFRPLGLVIVDTAGAIQFKERRRFPRVRVKLPPIRAALLNRDMAIREMLTITLADISAGGTSFVSATLVPPLEQLCLELKVLDRRPPIRPLLTVIECLPNAVPNQSGPPLHLIRGAFTRFADDDEERLADFVTRQLVSEFRSFV